MSRHDIWDVHQAAHQLVAQAHTLSARHLVPGIPRVQFNQNMAYYTKRLVDNVESGHLTPEQAIQALLQEQRHLSNQAHAVARNQQEAIPDSVKRIPAYRLTRPVSGPDPERLLRSVHAQQLRTVNEQAPSSVRAKAPTLVARPPLFTPPLEPVEYHAPGFYIVPKSTTAQQLQAQLFPSPRPDVIAKFKALNPGLDQVKAGQMIVLSDPDNPRCTREEAELMATAQRVNTLLADLSPQEADFVALHREEIESFLTYGSTAVGIGESIFARHLADVKHLLHEIETLHTRTFEQHGHLRSPAFFAERKRLLTRLDSQLTALTKKGLGFPDHPKLKTALGISSRSLVHRAGRAGGLHQNPGYATHLKAVVKASRYVKYGGWIGTAVGGGASYMKVQDVCTAGNAEACEKVKYTEGGGFMGGVAGGAAVGAGLSGATASICAALGVPTAGTGLLFCGLVVVGVGSFAAGALGGIAGETAGEMIYEAIQ